MTDQPHDNSLALISQGSQLGVFDPSQLSAPMPFATTIVLHESVRIAGTTHVPNIDTLMDTIPQEAHLTFVREPANPADQWAIRVEHTGSKLGYVPADINELLARLMDGGKQVEGRLLDREQQGSWWKVHMEVVLVD